MAEPIKLEPTKPAPIKPASSDVLPPAEHTASMRGSGVRAMRHAVELQKQVKRLETELFKLRSGKSLQLGQELVKSAGLNWLTLPFRLLCALKRAKRLKAFKPGPLEPMECDGGQARDLLLSTSPAWFRIPAP